MRSLRDSQRALVDAVLDGTGDAAFPPDRLAVYRHAVRANYRRALRATYEVVKRLVGRPFFDAAVDHYVAAHPSRSGDLNAYGDRFADFLAAYAPAASLPYLPDVARLEWAIDEAARAADPATSRAPLMTALATIAPARLGTLRLRLAPTCRLVASPYPILRIYRANRIDGCDADRILLDEGADRLLVRREADQTFIVRLAPGEYAWLASLASGHVLDAAIDAAQRAEATFDLTDALREHVATGTLADVMQT